MASNVPGYEPALCFVTDGDADKLVEAMMVHLITLSDAAYDSLLTAYKYVLDNLKEQASVWDEVAATAHDDDENGKKTVNPYKTLERLEQVRSERNQAILRSLVDTQQRRRTGFLFRHQATKHVHVSIHRQVEVR